MVFNASLMAAASAAALAASFGLATLHYRRALRSLQATLRRYVDLDSELVEGDARHRVLLDHAPMGCVVWEPGYRIVEWNRQAEQIFGWTRDEMTGRHLVDALCREEDRDDIARQTAALFAGYASGRNVLHHVTRLGKTVVCEWHHAAMRDPRGNPVRVVSMCVDITGRREIERENTLLRSLVEHTADPAIMVFDGKDDARVLYANTAACRHLGLKLEELVGKSPADWDPSDPEMIRHWLERSIAEGSATFETEHRRSDGTRIPVEVTANTVEHDGHPYALCYVRDIAARRAAEARLRELEVAAAVREHEKRYREIFQHSSDAMFSIDVSPNGGLRFASINPAAEEAFGMPAETLNGMRLDGIAAGELGPDFGRSLAEDFHAYRSCIETGLPVEYDGELDLLPQRMSPHTRFSVRLIPLAGDAGIERIIGIARDVTAQRRYEAGLLERARLETRMSRYFANAPGFFLTLLHRKDGRWAMPFASTGIRATHGIDPEDVAQDLERFVALTHPDDREMTFRLADESERDLTRFHVEYRIRHPEKGERWIECTSEPFREPDGSTVWYGFMHDVTERRRMEDTLAASERQFRSLSENIPDNVARYTPDGRTTYVNPALLRTLGLSVAEMLGTRPSEAAPIPAFAAYEQCILDVARNGKDAELELSVPVPNGRTQYHNVRFAPERDDSGAVVGVIAIGRDVTERKQVEDALSFVAQRGWTDDAEDFLGALARHLGETLAVDYVIIDRLADEPGVAETAALYAKGAILPNMRYPLADTPCDNVMSKTLCCYPAGIQALFPEDTLLVDMKAESYVGVPLWDSSGKPLGLIAVLDGKPLDDADAVARLLQIVATRAAAELENERADRQLRTREREYRSLAENSPVFIVRYDREFRRIYANRTVSGVVGQPVDALVGSTPDDGRILAPDQAQKLMDSLRRAVASGQREEGDLEVVDRDGERRVLRSQVVPEYDFNGEVESVLVIGHDITAIRDAERRMSRFVANVPGFVFTFRLSPDGRFSFPFASPGIAGLFDLQPDDVKDDMTPLHSRVHPGDRPGIEAAVDAAARDFAPIRLEFRTAVPERAERWIECRSTPERDADGGILWHGVMLDIAERKRMEAALAAREREYRSLAENLPDNIARWDAAGRILYTNPTHQRTLGKTAIDLIGKTHGELFPDGRYRPVDEAIARIVATRMPVTTMRAPEIREDGETRLHDIRMAAEFDTDGKVVGVLGIGRDMTDIYRMQETIAAREQEFRTLAENLPDPVFRYDRDGRRLFANQAVASLTQIERDALVGQTPQDQPLIPAAVAEEVLRVIRAVVAAAEPRDHEIDFIGPFSGRRRIMQNRYVPEFGPDGEVASVLSISRDITPLREALETLSEKERSLAEAQRMGSIGSWELDLVDNRLTWSDEVFRIFEIDPARFGASYEAFLATIHPDDRDAVNGAYTRSLANREPYAIDHRLLMADGRIKYVHERCETRFDADGKPLRSRGTVQDITRRTLTEIVLRRREQEFRTLAENSPDIIVRYDRDGRRTYINDAYEIANRMPKESLLGKTVEEAAVFPPEQVRQFTAMLRHVVDSGESGEVSLSWLRDSGEPISFYLRAVPEFDEIGNVASVLTVARDITALKESERRLVESREQLQELTARREEAREEERRRIARDLHEELGQTLTALRMNISTLPLQYGAALPELTPRTQSMLGLVDRALQGMRSAVMTLRPTALDAGIATGLDWLAREFSAHTGIACSVHLADEPIDLDDARATTVFRIAQEALTNIARHAQAGRADVRLVRHGGQWLLEIRDDGIGFDPDADGDKGFGLRSIAERALSLDGELSIASAAGNGALIRLRFS